MTDLLDGFDEGDAVPTPETADGAPTVDTIIAKLSSLPAVWRSRPLTILFEHDTLVISEVTAAGILKADRHPF